MRALLLVLPLLAACRRETRHEATADPTPEPKPEKAQAAPSASLPDEAELLALADGKSANPAAASEAMGKSRPAMKQCFAEELARDPKSAGGLVEVALTVDVAGLPTSAVAKSTTASKLLTECVVAAAKKVTFKPTGSVTNVLVPFNFQGKK